MPDRAPPAVASLADLLSRVSGRRTPPRVAIARSADAFVLSAAAEAVETMEDLVAEAKAELVAAEEKAHGGKDPQAATDQPA